ncbi:MAG: ATP-binding protein [Verrucomicrobia bacterium]|nr:ATP-binding protein [Verrucomicrobiota bacterium]
MMNSNTPPEYEFSRKAARILNSGQARSIVLTGNIHDLFCHPSEAGGEYVPLLNFLLAKWNIPNLILIVYELNGPIRFSRDSDFQKVRDAWLQWRSGYDGNALAIQRMLAKGKAASNLDHIVETFDESLRKAVSNPTLALELLRQMCLCSRTELNGKTLLPENLVILIEGADMLIPDAPITSLSDLDRQRVTICHDWFSDPGFVNGGDSVALIAESRSLLHHRIARLPQLLEIEIPSPDEASRQHFISWFVNTLPDPADIELWGTSEDLTKLTAGLSLHALLQILKGAAYDQSPLTQKTVVAKVETFIQSQLGDDIVEFKKPEHSLEDVIGFHRLKAFLQKELMPRFKGTRGDALAGAAVCGPIGGGKTFIFEALAAELDMVVLVIKNVRSQWFGQTDVVFERLRRVLNALAKVLIFVDEADTQFGRVGQDTHETERRLTGKIQSMMSDPTLRGRVFWLLVTARIHLLSPDLRRPGRVGDLIIPTLDPEGEDREEFLDWMLAPVIEAPLTPEQRQSINRVTRDFSTAGFASGRGELKAKTHGGKLSFDQVFEIISDHIPPAIGETRRYQTLQALINCTRRSLLPDPNTDENQRRRWAEELKELEARGVS